MPKISSNRDEIVEQAAALAQEVAQDLQSILITVFPDAARARESDFQTHA